MVGLNDLAAIRLVRRTDPDKKRIEWSGKNRTLFFFQRIEFVRFQMNAHIPPRAPEKNSVGSEQNKFIGRVTKALRERPTNIRSTHTRLITMARTPRTDACLHMYAARCLPVVAALASRNAKAAISCAPFAHVLLQCNMICLCVFRRLCARALERIRGT